jgi:hypothetical protein
MKKISMPYEEYLEDVESAKNQLYHERVAPVMDLIEVGVSGARTHDGVPHCYWKFQGTVEELLNALCKIHGVDNLQQTMEMLEKRLRKPGAIG